MTLDEDVLLWLYLRDSRMQQVPPDGDDGSFVSGLTFHRYQLLALLVVVVTLLLAITMLRSVRSRKENNQRPASLQCINGKQNSLAGTIGRTQRPSLTNFTATDTTAASRPRFPFLKSQTNPSPSRVSARRTKLTLSTNSPNPMASGPKTTAVVATSKHSFAHNKGTILANDSANKTTKAPQGEGHLNMAANVITFTKSKTPPAQLSAKDASKVVQSLERTANLASKEDSSYPKNRKKCTSLTQEVSICPGPELNECSDALTSKHQGDSDCRKASTEGTDDGLMAKLPALAIDKFREINCLGAVECKDSLSSSHNHVEPTVKGYDSQSQSYCQAEEIHNETKVSDQINVRHDEERVSEFSIEDDTNAVKISLRDERYIPIHQNSRRIIHEAFQDMRYLQGEQNVKSDSIKSDSVMSVNEAAVDLISGNLSSICRKYSNIQQDNNSVDSRMCDSTRCRGPEGHLAYSALHEVKTNNKSSQWTSHGAEIAEHAVQTQRTRIDARSPYEGSFTASDDHSWSFTRRNPVFEDRYTSFMNVSSLSKRRTQRLRRTIQVEPRPSKKLIIPKTKSEKQRLHSEQWLDEMLHNKHKAPKLACLLLDPDDYLLENGKQIGAQKVYTKDGFKFIVPLTFVSYGSGKQPMCPLSEEPQDGVGFSLTNLSVDGGSVCKVDDVNSLDIRQMDGLEDIYDEHGSERNIGKSEIGTSRNTCPSSSHLSSMHAENTERQSGQVNCYREHELTGIMETKQRGMRNFQDRVKQIETGTGECMTPPRQMVKSAGRTNEIKEVVRRSDVSVCVRCVNSEYMNANDASTNVNEITRKGQMGKAREPPLKHVTEVESMKNVSKWLSDVCSCMSHHSNSSTNTNLGLKRQENLARKQSTRTHSFPRKDNPFSDLENYHHGVQEYKNTRQNHRPLANKYMTSGLLQSQLARKRLAIAAKNATGRKTDQGTSSQSESGLSRANLPVIHNIAKSMKRHQSHLTANDDPHLPGERHYKYNSESINDLEKDPHDVSTKHAVFINKEINQLKNRHSLDVDDAKIDSKKLERLQELIAKLKAKRTQDHFQCKRFPHSKRSHTDSCGDVSVLGSVPVSYTSLGNLASPSPAFAHMPLFKNRHNESVNIIVRLESSAQKTLIEKHTVGSLMSAAAASGDSSLPGEPEDCCMLAKTLNTSEPPITASTGSCILQQATLISGTKDGPLNVFGGQKLTKEITQLNPENQQTFSEVVDGEGHGQFRLRCAVLSTDHHGLTSVKKFGGHIQEEDTIFVNDLSESKERAHVLEDLTILDLSSDPTSIQLLMNRGNAPDKLATSVIEASGNGDVDMIHQANTEHNPALIRGNESNKANSKQLSIEQHDDSPACRAIIQKDTTLNVKLLPKCLLKENDISQRPHVSYGYHPQDRVKDGNPGTRMKARSRARSHQPPATSSVNCRLQTQEKKVQKDVRDTSTQHRPQLQGEAGVTETASNRHVMNDMDHDKVTAERHLNTCHLDSTIVTTSGHARNHIENSTQVPSEYANVELTEDFRSAIQCPGNDNGKQTNVVTNNKRLGLVRHTFHYKNKLWQQAAHLGEQYPEQIRDADLLNKAKTTNAENIPRVVTNTMSRQTDPCGALVKTLGNVSKENSARPDVERKNHLKQPLSHSSKLRRPTAFSGYKGIPKTRPNPHADDACLSRPGKDTADRTHKQPVKLSDTTNPPQLNRCSTFTGDVGETFLSSVFTNQYSQKETCTEKQDDIINITYSKENISSVPQTYISTDISPDSGNMSTQKHEYRPLCGDEDSIQTSNQMDHKRCRKGRLFPNNSERLIQQRQKCQTLAKDIPEPNNSLIETPDGQVNDACECWPVQKQASKKTNNKPESPDDETNQSIQCNEQVASPQFSQATLQRLSSRQKANVNSLSQSTTSEKKNQTSKGRSVCKVSTRSDNSLTFNADTIHKNNSTLQSKVKNGVKGDVTIKQQTTQTRDNEHTQESTSKLHSASQYWQESNGQQVTRLQVSNHGDSRTSGVDDGLKSATRCKFKKPSKLQDVLFQKMFKFCAGEDQKYDCEHPSERTASQITDSQARSLKEFNDRVHFGKSNDTWITKQFPEALKVDELRDNRTGQDGHAASRIHISKPLKFESEERAPGLVEKSHHGTDTSTQIHKQPSFEEEEGKEPGFETCADSILDETDDCCLPDHLPGKIGGSTDVSSAEMSDVGGPLCHKQLASAEMSDVGGPLCHKQLASVEMSDVGGPLCHKQLASAEMSDVGEPICHKQLASVEMSDVGEPICHKQLASVEMSDVGEPICHTQLASVEMSDVGEPICHKQLASVEMSDVGEPICHKQLASVDDERPAAQHGDRKSTCHVNVDELREKYLREMSQKGLCRKRTFRIKIEKNEVQDKDLVDSTMVDSKTRTFSSDTTIIKSPMSLHSRNMAAVSEVIDFYTTDICCSTSQNYLKRKREDDKYEGPNAAKKSTSRRHKSLVGISNSGKSISKEIHDKLFRTGSDAGKLQSTTLKNDEAVLNSHNDMTIKQIECETMKICSPKSRPDVSTKKPRGSREVGRVCSPNSQPKSDSRQVEPHRNSPGYRKLRRQFEISKSNSPSSTSANIHLMDHSELMTQTLLPTAINRAKQADHTRVNPPAEVSPFSTMDKYVFLAGPQEHDHQSSTARGPQKFGSRRSSQIPKMKRSETSSNRKHRSDTHSFSHTHPVLSENREATTAKHSQSSSFSRLETISIKQQRMNETHSVCQSSNDTNKTVSQKDNQQKDVNTRSLGSSTDVIISWFDKETVHDTYQQDSDTELILSPYTKPQSTVSRSPSNYTLTTVCGFQGETVLMSNTPRELVGTAESNKLPGVKEAIPSVKNSANEITYSKIQANREEMSERTRRERHLGKNVLENITLENANEELATNKEDSNKLPFWQKQPRSNSMTTGHEADKSVFGKRTTSFRVTGSSEGIVRNSNLDRYSGKVQNRVQEFDNKSPDVNKEPTETSNLHQQEGELKRPGEAHIALPSRLRAMRGLAKNRKYVNSALMYNMKKQGASLPYKKASDTKEQHGTLKNPALSTNNSAVLDKGEFHLRYQKPSKSHLCNIKVGTSRSSNQRFEFQTIVHKNTTASKVYQTTNQNAIYFHSTHEPVCKQMRLEITQSESSSGPSMEGYGQGSTDSCIEKSASGGCGLERSIFPITVPFCAQAGDTNHMEHVTECSKDAQHKPGEFEDNAHEEDNDQNQGTNPENVRTEGSVCTASDSCKVSFDWYKPLASSTAQPCEHAQVAMNEHQRRGLLWRRSAESDHSAVGSDLQQLSMLNALAGNGEVNYGTRLVEETRPAGQESFRTWTSWNHQGLMQTHILNSRPNVRPGLMSGNRRISGEHTRQCRNSLTPDLAEPNLDATKDSLYQRPRHLVPFDMAQNPQNYCQHERMDQPMNNPWADQLSRSCHTSPGGILISDSRRHCIPNIPQSCSRRHKRPGSQDIQVPAKDASLSNLNALYEHLQHNYNQTNAVYHSNWVLANQNNSLGDLKTIPGQFGYCAHSKINVGGIQQHLLLQQRDSDTYNSTRTHNHPCYQNITSNEIFPHAPSNDDRCVHFRDIISNDSVVQPVLGENRIPQGCSAQNPHFLVTGHNNPSISSHQKTPLNTPRIVPMTPAGLPASSNNPNWQHLHQHLRIPSNHHITGHAHPPTLRELSFLDNQQPGRWGSHEKSLLLQRENEHRSDSSYETARDYHNE